MAYGKKGGARLPVVELSDRRALERWRPADEETTARAPTVSDRECDDRHHPHVVGRILKRPAPYNPRWSYHYNPDTVDFFDVSIEVCVATFPYVEEHLDEAGGAFLPGLVFCPWTSRLVRELPAP